MNLVAAYSRLPPGMRFHPMDDELVMYWLKKKVMGEAFENELVGEVDIYLYHPQDLPGMAVLNKDLIWYFFCPIRKKYGCGNRKVRATKSKGFWKITGNPKDVLCTQRIVGKVHTLVFYQGKPNDCKITNWVMYEYSFVAAELETMGVSDAFVLCKIVKKSKPGPRTGEQFGAPFNEEEWNAPAPPFEQLISGPVSVSDVVDQAFLSDPANVASTSSGAAGPIDAADGMYLDDDSIYIDLEDLYGIQLDDLNTPLSP